MKALRYHEFGGPEVLRIDDVPVPEPGPGQALIADLKVRPVIDAVVPLIRAIKAQREVGEGHTFGKMVIDVRR